MAGRGSGPDFVEALARGLDVLTCFDADHRSRSLTDVATAAGLARPTARRLLLTLEELGFVRSSQGMFELTPKVLTSAPPTSRRWVSGTSPGRTSRPWSRGPASPPRWRSWTAATSSTWPGCRCRSSSPCGSTSARGSRRPRPPRARCCWPPCPRTSWRRGSPSPAGPACPPYIGRSPEQLRGELTEVRARGWALADEELAPGVRSVAVPVRDGAGAVRAAMNVTVHAAETSRERLLDDYLPLLLRTAGDVSAEWALWQSRPHVEVARDADPATA